MRVLITGSNGFIGRNLKFYLFNFNIQVLEFNRGNKIALLKKLVENVDIIFHLAGENRSINKNNFNKNNFHLTKKIVDCVIESKKKNSNNIYFYN